MVSDHQVIALWRAYKKTGSIRKSALKANMNRKTAAKYISSRKLPSETEKLRHWKTHKDKIGPIWDTALSFLNNEPQLEAKALFEHLLELHPDKIHPSQLRTFQRRVKEWRLIFGQDQEVYFDQISIPGEVAQLDWLVMNSLGIKVCNEQFDHKLIHFTLKYSNTESVSVCRSESILSIKKGLREFLYRVAGKAPLIL